MLTIVDLYSSQRKHPSKLADFSACVRKPVQEQGGTSKQPGKQAKLSARFEVGGVIRVSQETVDRLLIRLMCEGHHPFSLDEQPAFKDFVAALNPQCKVLSRPTIKKIIADAASKMKTKLILHLINVNYVCTPTKLYRCHVSMN